MRQSTRDTNNPQFTAFHQSRAGPDEIRTKRRNSASKPLLHFGSILLLFEMVLRLKGSKVDYFDSSERGSKQF